MMPRSKIRYVCHCVAWKLGFQNEIMPRVEMVPREMPEHVTIHHAMTFNVPTAKAAKFLCFSGARM